MRVGWWAVAALSGLLGLGSFACAGERDPRPPILLITLDTTRPDRLGLYGYAHDTSPHLDALARDSVVYTRALSTSSWTLPAHASLFTGKFTSSHGARYDRLGPLRLLDAIDGRPNWADFRARGLSPGEVTLAETLGEAGYATGAVVAGPWMKRIFGLAKGFQHYDDSDITSVAGRLAPSVTDAAIEWLEGVRDGPFLLFLNYYDPHGPLNTPLPFVEAVDPDGSRRGRKTTHARQSLYYDAEIRFMDHHLGRLLDRLKAWGLYEDTWILVTADHGELLGEHGKRGHGKYLTQEELQVPLIVKHPRGEVSPGRDDTPVQLTDLFPWICRRLGLDVPAGVQGGAPPEVGHPLVAEIYPLAAASRDGDWRALYEGDFKFLWSSRGNHQLFDLAKDPEELDNRIHADPERSRDMGRRLAAYLAGLPPPAPAPEGGEIDAETRKALQSLGYIDAPADAPSGSAAPGGEGASR